MNIRDRYSRLTLWNKTALWGALASILALLVAIVTLIPKPASQKIPHLDILYNKNSLSLTNSGTGGARDVRLYSVLYSIDDNRHIYRRDSDAAPSWKTSSIPMASFISLPRESYANTTRMKGMTYHPKTFQSPFLVPVVRYTGEHDPKPRYSYEIFFTHFLDDNTVFLVPITHSETFELGGNSALMNATLEEIRNDIRIKFLKD